MRSRHYENPISLQGLRDLELRRARTPTATTTTSPDTVRLLQPHHLREPRRERQLTHQGSPKTRHVAHWRMGRLATPRPETQHVEERVHQPLMQLGLRAPRGHKAVDKVDEVAAAHNKVCVGGGAHAVLGPRREPHVDGACIALHPGKVIADNHHGHHDGQRRPLEIGAAWAAGGGQQQRADGGARIRAPSRLDKAHGVAGGGPIDKDEPALREGLGRPAASLLARRGRRGGGARRGPWHDGRRGVRAVRPTAPPVLQRA
mmetsp:Transcript_24891/g.80374  ORF Transcript_24891/g.80374 Transcript_24891/m.80374 type:complete len:260 (-) Transcript_24891:1196-1975(-)